METYNIIEVLSKNFNTPNFGIGFILLSMSFITAMLNIVLAKHIIDDMSIPTFVRRWVGSLFTFFILLLISTNDNAIQASDIALVGVYLVCIREMTISLKFTGIDLTGLTIFIDIALKFVEKKGLSAMSKKPG